MGLEVKDNGAPPRSRPVTTPVARAAPRPARRRWTNRWGWAAPAAPPPPRPRCAAGDRLSPPPRRRASCRPIASVAPTASACSRRPPVLPGEGMPAIPRSTPTHTAVVTQHVDHHGVRRLRRGPPRRSVPSRSRTGYAASAVRDRRSAASRRASARRPRPPDAQERSSARHEPLPVLQLAGPRGRGARQAATPSARPPARDAGGGAAAMDEPLGLGEGTSRSTPSAAAMCAGDRLSPPPRRRARADRQRRADRRRTPGPFVLPGEGMAAIPRSTPTRPS